MYIYVYVSVYSKGSFCIKYIYIYINIDNVSLCHLRKMMPRVTLFLM